MKTARRVAIASTIILTISWFLTDVFGAKQGTYTGPTRPFPFMQDMGQTYRELRAQIKNPAANADSLALVSRLQRSSIAAKDVMPPGLNDLPEAERRKFATAYKRQMIRLLHSELDLETQLLDNDNGKATSTLRDIARIMQEGHRTFRRRSQASAPPAASSTSPK